MVNEQAVIMLYKSNPVVKKFLDKVGRDRQRNRWKTTIANIMSDLECSRQEAVRMCKAFEKIDAGRYIIGRKGHQSRIEWSEGIVALSKIARGSRPSPEDRQVEFETADEGNRDGHVLLNHSFHLRPDLTLELCLPHDLSQSEAERVARFVQSLPFAE